MRAAPAVEAVASVEDGVAVADWDAAVVTKAVGLAECSAGSQSSPCSTT